MNTGYYDIIRKPLITEKSNLQKDKFNQFTFEVSISANRIEIKRALEKIFNIKVVNVRTVNVKGKVKRVGKNLGKSRSYKKAIISLPPGEKIKFFEGI